MRIKDQERLMAAVKEYLVAKDRYISQQPPAVSSLAITSAYLDADEKLRKTYLAVYAAIHT